MHWFNLLDTHVHQNAWQPWTSKVVISLVLEIGHRSQNSIYLDHPIGGEAHALGLCFIICMFPTQQSIIGLIAVWTDPTSIWKILRQ